MAILEKPLSNLQLELLKLYSQDVSNNDLMAIKKLLSNYFANKASNEMDKLWDNNNWSNETMQKWLSDEKS